MRGGRVQDWLRRREQSGAISGYCPFELTNDHVALGLVQDFVPSTFGRLNVVHSPQQTSDTVTLFVHGVGGSWATWSPLIRQAMATGAALGDVAFVDLPGFGQSENKPDNLDLSDVGRELIEAVRRLGWERIRLVGQSMGGFLALDMLARSHPEIVEGVVFAGAFMSLLRSYQRPVALLTCRPRTILVIVGLILFSYVGPARSFVRFAERHGRLKLLLHGFYAHPARVPSTILQATVASLGGGGFSRAARNARGYDPAAMFARITVPTAIYFGSADWLVPRSDARYLHGLPSNVSLATIEDVGHFAHIERPDEILRRVQPAT